MNQEITSYIASCSTQSHELPNKLRNFILQEVPQAEEVISYKMHAYKLHGMLVYFAGYEKHIGFYPTGSGIKHFEQEIQNYKYSKGTIQFPLDQELPYDLIRRIIQLRVHAAHPKGLNTPIVGDDLYGTKGKRLHLHAESITFRHPISKEIVTFQVDAEF